MKLINIGGPNSNKEDAIINVDLQSVVSAIKVLPKWAKTFLVVIIVATAGYFISFKGNLYFGESKRMTQLIDSSVHVNEKIVDVQNILYNYNIVLKYYDTSIKLLSMNQSISNERQQLIIEYLGQPYSSNNYKNLLKRLEDNTQHKDKIESLYRSLLSANEEDITKIIDNVNLVLTKMIEQPKLLNN